MKGGHGENEKNRSQERQGGCGRVPLETGVHPVRAMKKRRTDEPSSWKRRNALDVLKRGGGQAGRAILRRMGGGENFNGSGEKPRLQAISCFGRIQTRRCLNAQPPGSGDEEKCSRG